MDRLIAYIVRLMVWLSGMARPLSRLGLLHYEEWQPGKPLKILLVGYNGARNTGADARVVALTQQLEQALGAQQSKLTVMTLNPGNMQGYFSRHVRLFKLTTFFFIPLLRAASSHHVAVLCEGSTLTRTFADALTLFFCQASGIMKQQGKPCIAYGSEVGPMDGWIADFCKEMCSETYFMVRTQPSMKHLHALGLRGHVGTDTAWTFQTAEGESWAREQLLKSGWDGQQPLLGVAVVNPFSWPVRPSLWKWLKAVLTRNFSLQYDLMYFFSDSEERQQKFQHYLEDIAGAVNQYQQDHKAFVVVLGMEKLDAEACRRMDALIEGPHVVHISRRRNVFEMTGLLRQLSALVTSRYHAAVLSMERAIPVVAVSMDGRLDALMNETQLDTDYLFHVDDASLGAHLTEAMRKAEQHRPAIASAIQTQLIVYKQTVKEMSEFFTTWLNRQFS